MRGPGTQSYEMGRNPSLEHTELSQYDWYPERKWRRNQQTNRQESDHRVAWSPLWRVKTIDEQCGATREVSIEEQIAMLCVLMDLSSMWLKYRPLEPRQWEDTIPVKDDRNLGDTHLYAGHMCIYDTQLQENTLVIVKSSSKHLLLFWGV